MPGLIGVGAGGYAPWNNGVGAKDWPLGYPHPAGHAPQYQPPPPGPGQPGVNGQLPTGRGLIISANGAGEDSSFGPMCRRPKSFYLLLTLLVMGIAALVFIVVSSAIIYVTHTQRFARRPVTARVLKDPCASIDCLYGARCIMDQTGDSEPGCRCEESCNSHSTEFVCASDGRTYLSPCHVRLASCTLQQPLYVKSSGRCDTKHSAVPAGTLPTSSTANRSNSTGTTSPTPAAPAPVVCGGVQCDLGERCIDGRCRCPERCLDYPQVAEYYSTISVGGKEGGGPAGPKNISALREEDDPFCGSDGRDYRNLCELFGHRCRTRNAQLQVKAKGKCGGCELQCKHYAMCEINLFGDSECVCPQVCIAHEAPVCGSDGNTYPNECELRVRSCKAQEKIHVKAVGPCDECQAMSCKHGAKCEKGLCVCPTHCPDAVFEPICANDGNTYTNECQLRKRACEEEMDLRAMFYGQCEDANGDGEDGHAGESSALAFMGDLMLRGGSGRPHHHHQVIWALPDEPGSGEVAEPDAEPGEVDRSSSRPDRTKNYYKSLA